MPELTPLTARRTFGIAAETTWDILDQRLPVVGLDFDRAEDLEGDQLFTV